MLSLKICARCSEGLGLPLVRAQTESPRDYISHRGQLRHQRRRYCCHHCFTFKRQRHNCRYQSPGELTSEVDVSVAETMSRLVHDVKLNIGKTVTNAFNMLIGEVNCHE